MFIYGGFLKKGYPQSSSILVGPSLINPPLIQLWGDPPKISIVPWLDGHNGPHHPAGRTGCPRPCMFERVPGRCKKAWLCAARQKLQRRGWNLWGQQIGKAIGKWQVSMMFLPSEVVMEQDVWILWQLQLFFMVQNMINQLIAGWGHFVAWSIGYVQLFFWLGRGNTPFWYWGFLSQVMGGTLCISQSLWMTMSMLALQPYGDDWGSPIWGNLHMLHGIFI